jgi:hypothetical protein
MSSDTLSLIVWCRQDAQGDAIQLRIIRVDTGETIRIRENTLLLRITTDASAAIERCAIRHIASGREAYAQGGVHLRAFINDCILQQREPPSDIAPDTSAT